MDVLCIIPKGISPNGDGDNDTFDLTGLGVKELSIINRYGMEVFSFKGKYTNQFVGDAKNGNQLPDGTYFYVLKYSKSTGGNFQKTGYLYLKN